MPKRLYNLKVNEISILFAGEPAVPAAKVLTIKSKETNAMNNETLMAELDEISRLLPAYFARQREQLPGLAQAIWDTANEISDREIENLKKRLYNGKDCSIDETSREVSFMGHTESVSRTLSKAQQDHLARLKKWNPKAYQKYCEGYWRSVNRDAMHEANLDDCGEVTNSAFRRRYGGN